MPKTQAESFPLIAAIDLGSNSFHMVLAKPDQTEIRPLERLEPGQPLERERRLVATAERRPDLLDAASLTPEERALLLRLARRGESS